MLKRVFFTTFFMISTFFSFSSAAIALPSWTKNLKWPSDRVQDQVKLLPFAQEFKLNYFLQGLKDQEDINLFFHFTPSLEGRDLDEATEQALKDNLGEESSGLIFFLSLSDRKFKVLPIGVLKERLSGEDVTYLVKGAVPYLSQQNYAGAISSFLSNLLFKLKGNHSYKVPELSLKKSYNLNSLLFFTVGALLIFMLGHKIRKSPKVLAKDAGLVKKKTNELAIFW